MLLDKSVFKTTVCHVALEEGQRELFHEMWEWSKEVLTPEELSNTFFAKDEYKRTAWILALEESQIELLHKLWEWAE
jgi:hypothetical protein